MNNKYVTFQVGLDNVIKLNKNNENLFISQAKWVQMSPQLVCKSLCGG